MFMKEMTFKSLTNLGGFDKAPWDVSVERYHNDGSGYHHGYRGYDRSNSKHT